MDRTDAVTNDIGADGSERDQCVPWASAGRCRHAARGHGPDGAPWIAGAAGGAWTAHRI